jgi:hypothetical protein
VSYIGSRLYTKFFSKIPHTFQTHQISHLPNSLTTTSDHKSPSTFEYLSGFVDFLHLIPGCELPPKKPVHCSSPFGAQNSREPLPFGSFFHWSLLELVKKRENCMSKAKKEREIFGVTTPALCAKIENEGTCEWGS